MPPEPYDEMLSDEAKYESMGEEDRRFGYSVRSKLHPGESAFFEANPNVSGMAAEDNTIILNPGVGPEVNTNAVIENEAFRLFLRDKNRIPEFGLSQEQIEAFQGTSYENNPDALRSTIAARIYSGDPSALATEEQREWLKQFLSGLD